MWHGKSARQSAASLRQRRNADPAAERDRQAGGAPLYGMSRCAGCVPAGSRQRLRRKAATCCSAGRGLPGAAALPGKRRSLCRRHGACRRRYRTASGSVRPDHSDGGDPFRTSRPAHPPCGHLRYDTLPRHGCPGKRRHRTGLQPGGGMLSGTAAGGLLYLAVQSGLRRPAPGAPAGNFAAAGCTKASGADGDAGAYPHPPEVRDGDHRPGGSSAEKRRTGLCHLPDAGKLYVPQRRHTLLKLRKQLAAWTQIPVSILCYLELVFLRHTFSANPTETRTILKRSFSYGI